MIIGIEASRANKSVKTGVQWYARHVIQELKKITTDGPHSWLLYTNTILQDGLDVFPQNWHEKRLPWPFPYGWTQLRLAYELYRHPADVMFFPCSPLPRAIPKRTVVTLHDAGFHRFPQLYPKREVRIQEATTRDAVKRAARIITVSDFSKQELMDAYNIEASRITVTPLGMDHESYHPVSDDQKVEECLTRYRLAKPFFMALGRIEAKKNTKTLIEAFTQFKSQRGVGDPYQLVLVGIPGFGYDEVRRAINTSSARSHIVELGYVTEIDIPLLLNAAEALVHPAWYEGSGLPALQAMACGCPIISSTAGALQEVIGPDAALFASPEQHEAFAHAMNRLVSEVELRESLRAAGLERARDFTWEQTAKATLPVLSEW